MGHEAECREEHWDRRLQKLPVCADCGQPITEERALPLEGGLLCPECVRRRMIWLPEGA